MADLKFEIKESYGTLSENSRGWKKQVNLVSWNNKDPKVEIRDWSEDNSNCGKGITFTLDEFKILKDTIAKIDIKKLSK